MIRIQESDSMFQNLLRDKISHVASPEMVAKVYSIEETKYQKLGSHCILKCEHSELLINHSIFQFCLLPTKKMNTEKCLGRQRCVTCKEHGRMGKCVSFLYRKNLPRNLTFRRIFVEWMGQKETNCQSQSRINDIILESPGHSLCPLCYLSHYCRRRQNLSQGFQKGSPQCSPSVIVDGTSLPEVCHFSEPYLFQKTG